MDLGGKLCMERHLHGGLGRSGIRRLIQTVPKKQPRLIKRLLNLRQSLTSNLFHFTDRYLFMNMNIFKYLLKEKRVSTWYMVHVHI